jgi:CBS domain-containing protein
MDVELLEIRDFLAQHAPFEWLPEETLNTLVKKLSIRYLRKNSHFPPEEDIEAERVYLIRQGAITLKDEQQTLLDVLSEGDIYYSNCLSDQIEQTIITEDTLLYVIGCDTMKQLAAEFSQVDYFINHSQGNRIRKELRLSDSDNSAQDEALFNMKTKQLIHSGFEPVNHTHTIQEVAQIMTDTQQNAVIVQEAGKHLGIITDQDLRSRCVAAGISAQQPITEIMTANPVTVSSSESAFNALLAMNAYNIHHLPVLEGDKVIGIISGNDIIDWQGNHSLSLVKSVEQCKNRKALINVTRKLPQLQVNLIKSGYSAYHFTHVLTSIVDAITRKLIELAQLKLGKAPVEFIWLAVGSQGRQEQTISSDQDNALLLSNDFQAQHEPYFHELTQYVTEGLDQCGIQYCHGEVMASNPLWQKTLKDWKITFQDWIEQPQKKSIMLACNFFDFRAVYSENQESTMIQTLHQALFSMTRTNSMFIAAMTAQIVRNEVPIGFFRQFVLQREGSHADSIDLKRNALILISDMARIFAMEQGIASANTIERLKQAANTSSLSKEGSDNLIDAWEIINSIRLNNQIRQINNNETVDNYLIPDDLSSLERNHLKDCFSVIRTIQKALEQRNQTGRFM